MKLTTANIELPEGKNDLIVFDSELTGFGLRIRRLSVGVRKNWIIQYKQRGHGRRMIVGSVEKLTAAQARKQATKLLSKVVLGGDPQGEKKNRREADQITLRHVITQYLEHKNGRPNTIRMARNYLEGPLGRRAKKEDRQPYLKPIASMPIDAITKRDVARVLLAVEKDSGIPTTISLRGALTALFSWAMTTGLVESSPMINSYKPNKPASRDRVLSVSELSMIWRGVEDDDYGKCIRLLILSGCRREEIGGMRRGEFSDDVTTWTIPKERSKSKRAHTLPVTPLMREIVDSVLQRDGNDHLFGRKGFTAWSMYKKMLDERLNLPPWRVHDIRRSVSTQMNDLGIAPPHVIEKILNHTLGGAHGIYNKSQYTTEVRNAMLRWSTHIAEIVEGGERKVLPMVMPAVAS
jgi:integrase